MMPGKYVLSMEKRSKKNNNSLDHTPTTILNVDFTTWFKFSEYNMKINNLSAKKHMRLLKYNGHLNWVEVVHLISKINELHSVQCFYDYFV